MLKLSSANRLWRRDPVVVGNEAVRHHMIDQCSSYCSSSPVPMHACSCSWAAVSPISFNTFLLNLNLCFSNYLSWEKWKYSSPTPSLPKGLIFIILYPISIISSTAFKSILRFYLFIIFYQRISKFCNFWKLYKKVTNKIKFLHNFWWTVVSSVSTVWLTKRL